MANVLVIQSSARAEGSFSRLLVDEFVTELQQASGPHSIVLRDLKQNPVPQLNDGLVQAIRTRPEQHDATQKLAVTLSDTLIAELRAADLVVLGAPMYNWGIPAALKAYLDQVMRIGMTFTYGAVGVEGLLGDKPAVAILARGGQYDSPDRAGHDFQKPYLQKVLTVIGLNPQFVLMNNTLRGAEFSEPALAEARKKLKDIAGRTRW